MLLYLVFQQQFLNTYSAYINVWLKLLKLKSLNFQAENQIMQKIKEDRDLMRQFPRRPRFGVRLSSILKIELR